MVPQEHKRKLSEAIDEYREETISLLDSLDEGKPLTKKDMEEMSRLVHHALTQFRDVIIDQDR